LRRAVSALLAIAACVLATAALGGTAAAARRTRPAQVVDCNVWASFPNIKISSARNLSCRAAARDMRSYRGNIHRRFRTPGGFVCERVSGGRLGGQWRCVRDTAAYRFEFGD
jgi:hypothetical protein